MDAAEFYRSYSELDQNRRELVRELARERGLALDELITMPTPRSERWYPLSSAQERIFFLDALTGPSGAQNVCSIAQLPENVDFDLLRRSVERVAARHEVFRLRFGVIGGAPQQQIHGEPRVSCTHLQVEPGTDLSVEDAIRREVSAPVDLASGPLLRVLLISVPGCPSQLVMTVHHMVADGWSTRVLLREAGHVYARLEAGRPHALPHPPVQYLDYALQEHRIRQSTGSCVDLEEIAARLPDGMRAIRREHPQVAAGGFRPGAIRIVRSDEIGWPRMWAACRAHGMTLFEWLLSAWMMMLQEHSWSSGVPIAVPVTLRRRSELEMMIGHFSNLVVVVPESESSSGPLSRRLACCRTAIRSGMQLVDVPFQDVVRRLGGSRRGVSDTTYDLVFEYLDFVQERPSVVGPGEESRETLTSERSPFSTDKGTAECALFLAVWPEDEDLVAALEFDTRLFETQEVDDLQREYLATLMGMTSEALRSLEAPEDRLVSGVPQPGGEAAVRCM